MFKSFDDVKMVASFGKPDNVLNLFITSYLQGRSLREQYETTLEEEGIFDEQSFALWLKSQMEDEDFTLPEISEEQITDFKHDNYAMFRAGAYPPMEMHLDAVVKGDEEQKAEYVRLCQEVKGRFPKLEVE
ncbi:hypothetical protein [Maridesulfovibrio bastinii]|uniref:hypothetical protein n=1 Tax=Maridesulfovibrio bastinii TaxID=47157 RepID=UPI000405AB3F|nr:hypothetical protein [Maridesulfovibrio bastinii]